MTNQSTKNLISRYLSAKLAAGEDAALAEAMHEQNESPEMEASEHAPGGYEEGLQEPSEMGGETDAVEHMLSQLSPEDVQQLASQVSSDMETPGQGGDGEVSELANAIEQQLAQNPEASPAGMPAEKAAALSFVKSASYIEGFLNQAINDGANIKEAVDLYDVALTHTITSAKQASVNDEESVKVAAYYDGVYERALEHGFNTKEAAEIVEAAISKQGDFVGSAVKAVREGHKGFKKYVAKRKYEHFDSQLKRNPAAKEQVEIRKNESKKRGRIEGGVGGALAAGGVAALASSKKEEKQKKAELKGDQHKLDVDKNGKIESTDLKKLRQEKDKVAAYCEGIFKQALAYGFSEDEALAFVDQAIEKSALFGRKSTMDKAIGAAKKMYKSDEAQGAIKKTKDFASKNKKELAIGGGAYLLGKSRADKETRDDLMEQLKNK